MLALTNPGQFVSAGGPELFPFLIMMFAGVIMVALAFDIDEDHRVWRVLVAATGVSVALGGFLWMALEADSVAESRADAKTAYTEEVRGWLDHGYGIEVDSDDAAKLVAGTEIAVLVDGKQTAVELVDGTQKTIQVKVVGGHVLEPRN